MTWKKTNCVRTVEIILFILRTLVRLSVQYVIGKGKSEQLIVKRSNKMSLETEILKAKIMKYRGLGYRQKEIGAILGVSQSNVYYHLEAIREATERHGVDSVYKIYNGILDCIEVE